MWIDTHCHLDAADFDVDRDAVVARARRAGVAQVVLPAVEVANFEAVRGLAHRHGFTYALGIHPLAVGRAAEGDLDALRSALVDHRADERLVGIGEIGLDHFIAGHDLDRQRRFFVAQLRLAVEFELPVILHVRRSVDAVLRELRIATPPAGIAHAFNGSAQQAEVFAGLGLKLGFGGALTFERALRIRAIARAVPLDSIVLETDSPDIPPQWLYRSARERAAGATMRNEPAELPRIAAVLAGLRGIDIDELAAAALRNACRALPRLVRFATASAPDNALTNSAPDAQPDAQPDTQPFASAEDAACR